MPNDKYLEIWEASAEFEQSHRMSSMTHDLLFCLVISTVLLGLSSTSEKEVLADSSMLEVLQAEALDTITLDRAVHFTTPQATDVVAQAGLYRLKVAAPSAMKFIGLKTKTTAVVDALPISHQTDITEPVALYLKDDQEFPHVVLLLPGGIGFEALGSYDAVRSRDLGSQLTGGQIQHALKDKAKKRD
jgi:hypothetical protein